MQKYKLKTITASVGCLLSMMSAQALANDVMVVTASGFEQEI